MAMFGNAFRRTVCIGTFASLAVACGSVNPNKYLAGSGEQKSADYLVERARYYYDVGDFTKAADFAEQALRLNGENENAVVIAGYTYLSLAGVDPFGLARGLIDASSSQSSTTNLTERASSGNSADLLLSLSSVLGLTAADQAAMVRDLDNSSAAVKSAATDLDITLPKCVDDVRVDVSKVKYASKVIKTICPFVDHDIFITGDTRHSCDTAGGTRRQGARLHLLWAFGHLAESLALSTVLLDTGDSATQTPVLQQRVDAINAPGSSLSATEKLAKIVNVTAVADELYPTGTTDECNSDDKTPAFTALLNDLKSTSEGFAAINGMPEDISKSLTSSIDGVTSGVSDTTEQLKKLKAQMNANLATAVLKTITDNPAQKTDLCAQYALLMPGQATPTECAR